MAEKLTLAVPTEAGGLMRFSRVVKKLEDVAQIASGAAVYHNAHRLPITVYEEDGKKSVSSWSCGTAFNPREKAAKPPRAQDELRAD
ncbi:hypothetical protein [Silvibacterium acidisoli]|uniref:hypothetical protein n=1 Tax=Acidobacteriaceae bacterium ZG23-2 TaxID=2883246 RepID=UPI00406C4D16